MPSSLTPSTPSAAAGDWVTDLLHTHPDLGHLVWFTVEAGAMAQADWLAAIAQAGLAHYGLPAGIAPTTAYVRGLRTLGQGPDTRTLLRRVARHRGTVTHHWIRETTASGAVTFQVLAAITGHPRTGTLTTVERRASLTAAEETALARLPDAIQAAGQTYTAGDRRRQIRTWLARVGALTMVAAGPVQFVPTDAQGLLTALTRAQAALGLQVWTLPLARSADVIATVTASLDAEVTQKTAHLLHQLQTARAAPTPLTTAQQTRFVTAFQALQQRVEHYTQLLDDEHSALTQQLALARTAIMQMLTAGAEEG
ncbi:DUF6744 family protein [Sulfobacillus sp. hq2]|uniref:DUF6744 family protein n=1 Tax=Sulfobacillus sp. hq2 TaxID=2039167 RepID=UPI000CD12FA9|nr:DUF6744 family protein [Sulfobacillus sp. hq2]POB12212.1 hypothetical protein CO251_00870 [Sulfobacillus sp. hq2]